MIIAQNAFKMGYIVGLLQFGSGTPFGDPGINPGELLQLKTFEALAAANTTSIIPIDNTIPQSTEGAAYASLDASITPQRTGSSLVVRVFIPIVSCSGPGNFVGALFRDGGTDAIAANAITVGVANQQYAFELLTRVTGTVGVPTSFNFRYGPATAITAYVLSNATFPSGFIGATGYISIMEVA